MREAPGRCSQASRLNGRARVGLADLRSGRYGAEHFDEDAELGFLVLVRHLVAVERVDLDLLFGGDVVVDAEDRARGTDVVAEAVAEDRAALDPGGEVEAVAVGEGA